MTNRPFKKLQLLLNNLLGRVISACKKTPIAALCLPENRSFTKVNFLFSVGASLALEDFCKALSKYMSFLKDTKLNSDEILNQHKMVYTQLIGIVNIRDYCTRYF